MASASELHKPRPTTPSKIPTPTKRIPSSEHVNVCTICQRRLDSQFRSYCNISKNQDLLYKLKKVLSCEFFPSPLICRPCERTLNKIVTAETTKDKFVSMFQEHVASCRTKRMAKDSPQRPNNSKAKRSLSMSGNTPSVLKQQPSNASKENEPSSAMPTTLPTAREVSTFVHVRI